MRIERNVTALALVAIVAACNSLDVTDLNNPGLETIENNPTRSTVLTAASGLFIGARTGMAGNAGYISELGVFGRESYVLSTDDPRFVTELLAGPLQGGNGAFGGAHWAPRYANIRNANIVLEAVEEVVDLTDEEKAGIRGFAKTMQAYDLLLVINTRHDFGAPVDVDVPPTAPPAPVAPRAEVFQRVVQLLDEGRTELLSAGDEFAFGFSPGFSDFDTPATFIELNRAFRARVAVYLQDWNGALTALGESFLDTSAPLTLGAYHVYGTGSGDLTNASHDPTGRAIRAHPSFQANAQRRADNSLDLRAQTKNTPAGNVLTVQGISSDKLLTVYNAVDASIPIIRNEELILLRAEANIQLGNLNTAVADLNLIRQQSGGLPAYGGPVTQAALIDELLYNRRYSLYFEGHRWIDLRRYNRLSTLPRDAAAHRVFSSFPFPQNECLARNNQPADACSAVTGS
jgi:starch-binding outer membrane protein, SusD/RagB family